MDRTIRPGTTLEGEDADGVADVVGTAASPDRAKAGRRVKVTSSRRAPEVGSRTIPPEARTDLLVVVRIAAAR